TSAQPGAAATRLASEAFGWITASSRSLARGRPAACRVRGAHMRPDRSRSVIALAIDDSVDVVERAVHVGDVADAIASRLASLEHLARPPHHLGVIAVGFALLVLAGARRAFQARHHFFHL